MSQAETTFPVFLMYSSPDKAMVEAIHTKLLEVGVESWMDTKRIIAGDDWEKEIMTAIRNSSLVLIFLSNSSITRLSYFQKEIRYALDRASEMPVGELFIIPVKLDNCPIPDVLKKYQFVDFSKSKEKGWKALIQSINTKQKRLKLPLSPKIKFDINSNTEQEIETNDNEIKINKFSPNIINTAKTTNDIINNIFNIANNLLSYPSSDIERIAASQIQLLTSYYSLVLTQAQRSFTWALIWAFVGISSFIAAGVFLLVNQLNDIAYISAIGGALIEVVSGINFYLYNKSSSQLADFHTRLDSTQRILLANTICEKIEGDLKQETRSQLALAFAGVVKPQTVITEKEHTVPIIRISKINSNPEGKDIENEFIEISNFCDEVVDMTEWKLLDKAEHEFIFPKYSLRPRQSVSIWTKIGKDTETELFWNKGTPIWNNTQDCAYLRTNNGVLIDFYCYSSKPKAG